MPAYNDKDVSATLVVAEMESTLPDRVRLQMGSKQREAAAAIRQAFWTGLTLSERPLFLGPGKDVVSLLGQHGDLPCLATIASLGEEEAAMEGKNDELAFAVKVTLPVKAAAQYGTRGQKSRHIKTDIFLNGDLVESTYRQYRQSAQADVTIADVDLYSGVRVHRQVELPFVYRKKVQRPHNGLVISQQQRWTSVAVSLLERSREINSSAEDSGPPSAQYLAALAERDVPEQFESAPDTLAIIDVVMTAGHGRRQDSKGAYMKVPTFLKDGRSHSQSIPSTPQEMDAGSQQGSMDHASSQKSPNQQTCQSPLGGIDTPTPTSSYASMGSHEMYYSARRSFGHFRPASTHPTMSPNAISTQARTEPTAISHTSLDDTAQLHMSPQTVQRRAIGPPSNNQMVTPAKPRHRSSSLEDSPFEKVLKGQKEMFGLAIQSSHNTEGTPVKQMIALAKSGRTYQLTPVKHPAGVDQDQALDEGHPQYTGDRRRTDALSTRKENIKVSADAFTIDSAMLDIARLTPKTAKNGTIPGDAKNGLESIDQQKHTRPAEAAPKLKRKRSTRKNSSPLKQVISSIEGTPAMPGSHRTADCWNPYEDTVEQTLEKFEVPLLCRDSVVSYAGTHSIRQMPKARPGEFLEDEFVVGMRFVVV